MIDVTQPGRILVTCSKALSPWLAREIEALSFPVVRELEAGVETCGTLADTMTLNLHLRTAHRVLFLVADFNANNADQLYKEVARMPWEEVIPADEHLSVSTSVDNPTIRNTLFAAVKCKDAVVDRIRNVTGRRPDSGSDKTGAVLFLYWKGYHASIYLDTSGEALTKRGYRKIPGKAPMQETLAAGVLLSTGWNGEGHLINPMCGSGTLAIEGALLALNRAPGLLRGSFGFQHLKGYDEKAWEILRHTARIRGRKRWNGRIIASDIDARAIAEARQNAKTAGVDHLIEFELCDYAKTTVPEGGGIVMLNPEYGERMGNEEALAQEYFGIGDFFKQRCQGYRGYVFTGNLSLAKCIGLRSSRRIIFYNSRIECRLLEFELYQGTKRIFDKTDGSSPENTDTTQG